MGEMMHGGLAEKCLVAADQLIRMPDKVTFEQAASLPVAYGTAHRMIVTHDTIRKARKCSCSAPAAASAPAACCSRRCSAPK
jgi:NADPH:quinone reductase-like Zn-dependent oxidoreductase